MTAGDIFPNDLRFAFFLFDRNETTAQVYERTTRFGIDRW